MDSCTVHENNDVSKDEVLTKTMTKTNSFTADAVMLLQRLIMTPSVSRDEAAAADVVADALRQYGFVSQRHGNNVWASTPGCTPTMLLNAHIDTVKPVSTWTRDPFVPGMERAEDGQTRLYGLGSNDCGGGLVSLMQVFRVLARRGMPVTFLASCEEEVSGAGGIRSVLPLLPDYDVAIVGEPTGMQPAIAERGLMVIDAVAHGVSGHAARREGVNAISVALDDLMFVRDYRFERVSPLLGPTVMQTTVINGGTQHNVVPDECRFVIDVRTNECYTNEEVLNFLQSRMRSTLTARSTHLRSSSIAENHPMIVRCREMGMVPFGSPTLSDQALMRFPSFKLGPGLSARSHSADEYITVEEINDAIEKYLRLFEVFED